MTVFPKHKNHHATHQAAVSRRSCRKPPASRRPQGGARQREAREISPEELKAVEDREIEKVIRKQEEVGLRSVTDGEFRRAFWNY
jgi:hypothetical protein